METALQQERLLLSHDLTLLMHTKEEKIVPQPVRMLLKQNEAKVREQKRHDNKEGRDIQLIFKMVHMYYACNWLMSIIPTVSTVTTVPIIPTIHLITSST